MDPQRMSKAMLDPECTVLPEKTLSGAKAMFTKVLNVTVYIKLYSTNYYKLYTSFYYFN